ncbi:MAG: hypothetical protein WC793_03095 [Candidatus Paceibacterota bacterium]|jgi:hypothetical protein
MNKKILSILVFSLVILGATKALASLTFSSTAITGTAASTIDVGAGNALSLQTTNNGNIITGSGNVGVGITPTSKLHVAGDIQGNALLLGNGKDLNHSVYNVRNQLIDTVTAPLGDGSYYDNLGIVAFANFTVSQPSMAFNGIDLYSATDSAYVGNLNQINGVASGTDHLGSGTITSLKSIVGSAHNSGVGIVTNLKGGEFVYANLGSGNATNAYGIFVESPSNDGNGVNTNNITNAYGLYIQDQNKGTNKWNIYSAGATSKNTLEGSLSVGSALNKGTCVLGTSCASITVATGAICTATDTTGIFATRAVVSGTTLTITGNATDTIAYTCL